MTPDQARRHAEFNRLFESLPGPRNTDRVRAAAKAALVQTTTIRAWRLKKPHRVPSERSLELLRQALQPKS